MRSCEPVEIERLQRQLTDNFESVDWQSCCQAVNEFAETALSQDRIALAQFANAFSQWLDLVKDSDQQTQQQWAGSIAEQLPLLNLDIDDEQIEEPFDRIQDILTSLCIVAELPQSDFESNWHEELLSVDDNFEEENELTQTMPDQVDLLLSAISQIDQNVDGNRDEAECNNAEQTKCHADQTNRCAEISDTVTADTASQTDSGTAPQRCVIEDEDLKEAFLDDATGGLNSMEKCSLAFEQTPGNREAVVQFCRELHTLKGAASSVGLSELAGDIHDVESALAEELSATQTVELMLQTVDNIRAVVNQLATPEEAASSNEESFVDAKSRPTLDAATFATAVGDDSLIRIRASKLDRLMDMLAELVVLRNRRESHVSGLTELNEELKLCADRLSFFSEDQSRQNSFAFNSSLTLTELSKDISELSVGIRQLQRPVNKDNVAISHFIRDFRQELMELRRIPMAGLFNRVQRSARDAAKVEAKSLRFEVSGQDAGLERELQEKLFEPLLHLVRNSVSHGIEDSETRQKRGKPAEGLIRLTAQSNSQMVVVTIEDDGGGLDYEAIRRRGMEKGLIQPNQFLNENELANLIFHPGFSTRQAASEISGRGVGMDVVMTTIQQMRGRIEIDSQPGRGTSMVISVPVRAGIEHVMVFRAGGQLLALPMQSVAKMSSVNAQTEGIPSLASVLGIQQSKVGDGQRMLVLRNQGLTERVDQETVENYRFLIDETLGPEEVVIRKLPPLLQSHPLFCGLTLSGAGETALLLDADRLANFNHQISAVDADLMIVNEEFRGHVLVIDDSMSARKLLSKKLHAAGMRVTEAADGMEGLEQIRNGKFDLVFTDLDMPRMGGLELLFDLQQGRHKEQNVVVVSSRTAESVADRAFELGALAYLNKPVEDHQLQKLFEEIQIQS